MPVSLRFNTDEWVRRERERLLEFERKLEEGGVIAYHGDEGAFTAVLDTGFVIEVQMYAYPECSFMQVNGEYAY